MKTYRAVIFGPDTLLNSLLKDYLQRHAGLKDIVIISKGKELPDLSLLNGASEQTIALLDASDKNWSQLSASLENGLKTFLPSAKVVLFGIDPDSDAQTKALRQGVRGLIYSSATPESVLRAIRCVVEGQIWAPRKELERCISDLSTSPSLQSLREIAQEILSAREISVLSLVVAGLSNKEIANKLYISENTVKTHINNIFRKIGVANRYQAAIWVTKRISEHL